MTYLPPDPVTPPPTRGAWLKASEFDPRFYQPVTPPPTRGAWLKMVVPVRVNPVNPVSVGMILAGRRPAPSPAS